MTPRNSTNNIPYSGGINAEFFTKEFLCISRSTHFLNVFYHAFCEYVTMVFLSSVRPFLFHHIPQVVCTSSEEKVRNVNAASHITSMTNKQFFRDWTVRQLPSSPMSKNHPVAMTTCPNDAIPVTINCCHPKEASVFVGDRNVSLKPNRNWCTLESGHGDSSKQGHFVKGQIQYNKHFTGSLILALLFCVATLTSCNHIAENGGKSKITTSETLRVIKAKAVEISPQLESIKGDVDSLNAANVEAIRPIIQQKLNFVMTDFSNLTTVAIPAAEKSVAVDVKREASKDKRLDEYEADDATKWWINTIGKILALAGLAGIVLAVLPWTRAVCGFLLPWAIAAFITGNAAIAYAYFLKPIIWLFGILGGTALIVGAGLIVYYVWQHRKAITDALNAKAIAATIVTSIDKAKMGGIVDLAAVKQPPNVQAFVDQVQAKAAADAVKDGT